MAVEDAGSAAERDFDSASRWASICESSVDAIIGWTLDGVVTSWNAGAEQMYGYAAGEIVGRHVSELIRPDRIGELRPVLDRLARGERVETFETKAHHMDGRVIDVSVSISPIRDPAGKVAGVSSVARDVTERNRAEADQRALEQQLQEAERLETLGRLAGGIAHDFNNLLATIVTCAGFVVQESADRPRGAGRRQADPGGRAARGGAHQATADLQPAGGEPARGARSEPHRCRHPLLPVL